jgi:hypothetical protein
MATRQIILSARRLTHEYANLKSETKYGDTHTYLQVLQRAPRPSSPQQWVVSTTKWYQCPYYYNLKFRYLLVEFFKTEPDLIQFLYRRHILVSTLTSFNITDF